MKKIFSIILLLPFLAFSQGGMHFEHGKTWQQVVTQATKEKKFIIVDCFTTWCGPCKYMSSTIFPQKEVGDFYNKNFVNFKLQMDETSGDNAEVKSLYATAKDFEKKYGVNAYPTFLFFNPKGELVHKVVGGGDATMFIEGGKNAMNPAKQYFTLVKKFKEGVRDTGFLKSLAYAAQTAYDEEMQTQASDLYIAAHKDPTERQNLEFIVNFTHSTNSTGFKVLLENYEKADEILGNYKASKLIVSLITNEEIFSKLNRNKKPTEDDWKNFESSLKSKYPVFANEVLLAGKVKAYKAFQEWDNFFATVVDYMKLYLPKIDDNELNEMAWAFFEKNDNTEYLTQALVWSKKSITNENPNPAFIDTYANLLHKLGKTNEAIEWETKAISLVEGDEKKSYEETLEKMKKGEKTW